MTSIQKLQTIISISKAQRLLLAILLFQVFMAFQATAQGNLMLMQKRVVFEGNKRIATVQYANTGRDTARYVVSLVHNRMKEDGSMERIETPGPGEWFADDYVRYFPRNIVLGPNESQTMKIQLVNNRNMQPGEYRSHLYFRAVPNSGDPSENNKADDEKLSVSLKAVFGITIPLIIRVGENISSVQLTDLAFLNQGGPILEFSLIRSGNYSVYGDLTVTHVSPAGKKTDVGLVRGIAVYTPGTLRRVRMNMQAPTDVDFSKGRLLLRFSKQQEEKGTLLSEAELVLQ